MSELTPKRHSLRRLIRLLSWIAPLALLAIGLKLVAGFALQPGQPEAPPALTVLDAQAMERTIQTGAAPAVMQAPMACPPVNAGYPGYTVAVERTNFCVYTNASAANPITAAQATTAADHIENKYWPTLTAELGRAPKFTGKLEIYLVHTASGCNGGTGWSINYLDTYQTCINPDINFQKVLGHELTHRVQYAWDDGSAGVAAPHQTKTFKEGTARAIEDQFAPQDNWVGALGFSSSYAGEAKNAFANPNRNWWATTPGSIPYMFAPAWKYFSEQYPGATVSEPGYGWDYYQTLFTCTTAHSGIAKVNCAQNVMGGPTYYEMWKRFARALYTKDLTVASLPSQVYYFVDEQQAGDQPGPVAKKTKPAITSVTSQSWPGQAISHDGMDFFEAPIGADCQAPKVAFTNVTGNPYLWVIARSGNSYKFDRGGVAGGGSWTQSFLKGDATHVAAVVVGLSTDATADIEMSCGTPAVDIKKPLQLAPDYVQPLDVIVVQVLVTNGSPTAPVIAGFSYTDFTATIGGAPALIQGGGFVEEQYFLLVQAPNLPNGPKNLSITLGAASDTETEAVVYDLTNMDNVIVIDRSGSMGWYSAPPILAAQAAANFFIDASNSSEGLSVVAFNHDLAPAPLGMQFGTLPHRTAAHAYINALSASGGTSIGDGLAAPGPNGGAVDQINTSPTANARCQIILLSDGEENTPLMWATVQGSVVATGCPVMSIAFGPGADETLMQNIAAATGGLAFYNDVYVSSVQAAQAGVGPQDMHLDLGDTYLYTQERGEGRDRILAEKGEAFKQGEIYTHTALVDGSMTSLMATLDWVEFFAQGPDITAAAPEQNLTFQLTLVAPNGDVIAPSQYAFADGRSGHVGYRIENPQAGAWQLVVELLGQGPRKYEVHASGESQIKLELILLDQLQREQTTGQEVPIRALLPATLDGMTSAAAAGPISVVAEVTAPDGKKTLVTLYDDGQHNQYDEHAGDGLWAGVYTLVTQTNAVDQVGESDFPPLGPPKPQGGYRVVVKAVGPGFTREAKGAFAVSKGEDTNSDGLPDVYTEQYGPANEDPDLDALLTADEYFAGTNPFHSDSDSDDGVLRESDWSEVQNGQDPLNKSDDQIFAPDSCMVLGQNGLVELTYDVKPEYDLLRAFRRVDGGAWGFHTNLPIDTGGIYTDTLNVVNGAIYEYQINAVDGAHTSAQVHCSIATPLENWRRPVALMRLDDGVSTPDLTVEITFYPYEDEDGVLDFNEIHEMRISNSLDFSAAQWEPFQPAGKVWQLDGATPPDSIATVYAEFRNADGLTSNGPSVASIRYAPAGGGATHMLYLPLVGTE
jgi:hypothetical protein